MGSILFSAIQEISEYYSWMRTIFIGNVFVLSEAIFLGLTFYLAIKHRQFKTSIIASLVLYVFFYGISLLCYPDNAYSLIRLGRDSLMILYGVGFFNYLIREMPEDNLLQLPMFWINSAIIFFFSGTFVLSLMADYIVSVLKIELIGFWAFRNFFRLAFCLVLSYAGLLNLRQIRLKE